MVDPQDRTIGSSLGVGRGAQREVLVGLGMPLEHLSIADAQVNKTIRNSNRLWFDANWHNNPDQAMKQLARARHETVNRRFKVFNSMSHVWRHANDLHGIAFMAIINVTHLTMAIEGMDFFEHGAFQIYYKDNQFNLQILLLFVSRLDILTLEIDYFILAMHVPTFVIHSVGTQNSASQLSEHNHECLVPKFFSHSSFGTAPI